jgi:hypothetical protein
VHQRNTSGYPLDVWPAPDPRYDDEAQALVWPEAAPAPFTVAAGEEFNHPTLVPGCTEVADEPTPPAEPARKPTSSKTKAATPAGDGEEATR